MKTTVVVLVGALVAGLASGMSVGAWLDKLGQLFTENRFITLFILTLPVVGISERFGLQALAARWVSGLRGLRPAAVLILYQLFRVSHGLLGLRLNGHPTFVRPLVAPMAIAADPEGDPEQLKAASAASENYGNFYGQNLSPVLPGVLLVYGVLEGLGFHPSLWRLVGFSVPVVLISLLLGALQFRRLR